jgi:hypothetical protein
VSRLLFQSILLAALPFILYGLYVWLAREHGVLERTPWFTLIAAGLALAVLGLGVFAFEAMGPPEQGRLDSEGRVIPVPAISGPPSSPSR